MVAEVQAVWSALYLMKEFHINEDAQWDIVVTNAWLNSGRKKTWPCWSEMFETYMPRDYRGIVVEWLGKKKTRVK